MAETIITVQGEHSARYPSEQATVFASAQADGPEREPVLARVTGASATLRELVEALERDQSGAIIRWSVERVRVWSDRPWNNEGRQLPLVYHASIDLTVVFGDVDAVAGWLESAAAVDAVTIGSVSWDLTEATKTSVIADVRGQAVRDAVAKATTYALSIGLEAVTPLAIADPGMLGGGPQPVMARAAMKAQFDSTAAPQLALKPDEIVVAAAVDARFLAS